METIRKVEISKGRSVIITFDDDTGFDKKLVISPYDIVQNYKSAQHSLHTDTAWPPNHKDEPFCECSVCMGFTANQPRR